MVFILNWCTSTIFVHISLQLLFQIDTYNVWSSAAIYSLISCTSSYLIVSVKIRRISFSGEKSQLNLSMEMHNINSSSAIITSHEFRGLKYPLPNINNVCKRLTLHTLKIFKLNLKKYIFRTILNFLQKILRPFGNFINCRRNWWNLFDPYHSLKFSLPPF